MALKTDTAKIRRRFEQWGLHVRYGAYYADRSQPYFAGTDAQRACKTGYSGTGRAYDRAYPSGVCIGTGTARKL